MYKKKFSYSLTYLFLILTNLQVDMSDPFDTTITGPWIGKWEIVNHNKHTDAFKPAEG